MRCHPSWHIIETNIFTCRPRESPALTLYEVRRNNLVLTPGRYVGAARVADDSVPFAERMRVLAGELRVQFAKSGRLQCAICGHLRALGHEV